MSTIQIRRVGGRYPVTIVGCYHIALVRSHFDAPQWRITHADHITGDHMPIGYAITEANGIDRCRTLIDEGACQ